MFAKITLLSMVALSALGSPVLEPILATCSGSCVPSGDGYLLDLRQLPGDTRTATLTFEQPVSAISFAYDRFPEGVGTGICVAGQCATEDVGTFAVTATEAVREWSLYTLAPFGNAWKEVALIWSVRWTEPPPAVTDVPEPSGWMLMAVVVFMLGIRAVVSGLRRSK